MNLETIRLRGWPRNGWQDIVRDDGRVPENGKELSHSAHANGMNEFVKTQTWTRAGCMYKPDKLHLKASHYKRPQERPPY